jgi:gluconolactonase
MAAGSTIMAFALTPSAAVPRQFELKAESPKFWELFTRDAKLEKVAGGFGFTEGPVWDPKGFLYVSDEEKNKLSRVYPDGRVETTLEIGDPDGSTLDAKCRLVNGALYFTDPTLDLPKGEKQELPYQGVFRLGSDGSVRLLTSDLVQPNGLAFFPDGKRLYIDDTKQREIRVYDVDASGGLQNGRLFGKEEGRGGVPDGMRVDVQGNVYVTGPGGTWIWDPGGNHIGTILLPEPAANLNWGDADYRTLYITAKTSVYSVKTKVRGFVPGR